MKVTRGSSDCQGQALACNLIVPEIDIWKRIFNNSGLSDIFDFKKNQLSTSVDFYGVCSHNVKCYSVLNEVLLELVQEQDKFLRLLNSIVDKFQIFNVIDTDNECNKRLDLEKVLRIKTLEFKNNLLSNYPTKEFRILRSNINIINLDIVFMDDGLKVVPFTNRVVESSFDENILSKWLADNYSNIEKSYTDAIKAYSNGDGIGCIGHCRNIITGIFTINKQEQTKWMDGLKTACSKDKNIGNVTANKINTINYNINSNTVNERYQYPRYNLIYNLYTFTCALGAHANEGNKIESGVDNEVTTIEDALIALRMTEDVLIWLYQTNAISS